MQMCLYSYAQSRKTLLPSFIRWYFRYIWLHDPYLYSHVIFLGQEMALCASWERLGRQEYDKPAENLFKPIRLPPSRGVGDMWYYIMRGSASVSWILGLGAIYVEHPSPFFLSNSSYKVFTYVYTESNFRNLSFLYYHEYICDNIWNKYYAWSNLWINDVHHYLSIFLFCFKMILYFVLFENDFMFCFFWNWFYVLFPLKLISSFVWVWNNHEIILNGINICSSIFDPLRVKHVLRCVQASTQIGVLLIQWAPRWATNLGLGRRNRGVRCIAKHHIATKRCWCGA